MPIKAPVASSITTAHTNKTATVRVSRLVHVTVLVRGVWELLELFMFILFQRG